MPHPVSISNLPCEHKHVIKPPQVSNTPSIQQGDWISSLRQHSQVERTLDLASAETEGLVFPVTFLREFSQSPMHPSSPAPDNIELVVTAKPSFL
jgi:hypothetical protein